jgi:prepilin-type N-terminal cleavage/methylation domain-containing protein
MRLDPRRGFTLIELLVALLLLVIVGGGIYEMLITVQRVSRKQAEVSNLQGNLRSGMQLIQSELSEVFSNAGGAGSSDIESMSATAIRYWAMRGIGEACDAQTNSVKIRQPTWSGRAPTAATDSLLVYWDKDSTKTSDDVWVPVGFTAATGSTCPDGVTAAWHLPLGGSGLTAAQVLQIYLPSPIRTWEPMEIGSVTDNGQLWLGIRAVNSQATLVPVVGPLAANGLALEYRDKDGNVTANVNNVKSIWITLRGITDRTVSTGLGSALNTIRDSLQVRVELRNTK